MLKKEKDMKAFKILATALILIISIGVFAQGQEVVKKENTKKKEKPVRNLFSSGVLIDNQTVITSNKGALEMVIQHRFSDMNNMFDDLFGIYGTANIRLGLNYGITENLTVGVGTEKFSKITDFSLKYAIIKQTRSGSIPVSVTYYTDFGVDFRDEANFGKNYSFANRLSFFHEIMVARKIHERFSAQVSVNYSHFNAVDSTFTNDKLGIGVLARGKILNNLYVIAHYDQPISVKKLKDYQTKSLPNLAFGLEAATSTHSFQIFVGSSNNIIYQKTYLFNTGDFTNGDLAIGFNVNVKF
jgi:uncharacterized protein YutD